MGRPRWRDHRAGSGDINFAVAERRSSPPTSVRRFRAMSRQGEQASMRLMKLLVVLLLVPTMMLGQSTTGSTTTNGDTPNVSEQINKLSEAIATQQQQIAKQQAEMVQQQ